MTLYFTASLCVGGGKGGKKRDKMTFVGQNDTTKNLKYFPTIVLAEVVTADKHSVVVDQE